VISLYKTFSYPSGSSALAHLRKALKAVDPKIDVIGWTPLLENCIKKTRLVIYSPLLEEEKANLALEIFKETSKNLEANVQFNIEQNCMIPIDFKEVAQQLAIEQTKV
jgi:hypothetical protein